MPYAAYTCPTVNLRRLGKQRMIDAGCMFEYMGRSIEHPLVEIDMC